MQKREDQWVCQNPFRILWAWPALHVLAKRGSVDPDKPALVRRAVGAGAGAGARCMLRGWPAVSPKSSLGQHGNASAADSNVNSSINTVSMLPMSTVSPPPVAVAALPPSLVRVLARSSWARCNANCLGNGYGISPRHTDTRQIIRGVCGCVSRGASAVDRGTSCVGENARFQPQESEQR